MKHWHWARRFEQRAQGGYTYGATALLIWAFAGCGPTVDGSEFPATCSPIADTEVACTGGVDEDCDGAVDCVDLDCSDHPSCASSCGQLETPEASLALPDGEGVAYESTLSFSAFGAQQRLEDVSRLKGVCVVMEHSWLRDLQIELRCPDGQEVVLQQFLGQQGAEILMGEPNHTDGINPIPGVGAEYCWRDDASRPPMLEWANASLPYGAGTLPDGDYRPVDAFGALQGCTLNGDWQLRIEDLWASDNGFIFQWRLEFEQALVPDCSVW